MTQLFWINFVMKLSNLILLLWFPIGWKAAAATNPCGAENIELMYQESFELVYNATGSGANFAAFRVNAQSGGWHRVGDYGVRCHGAVPSASGSRGALIRAPGNTLRPPTDYEKVWDDSSSGERQHGSFWRPVPPAGYTCLGHVVGNTTNYNKPSTDIIRCIKNAYVVEATTAHVWGYFDSR